MNPFDEGDTLTHQLGHFFGLYNTFRDVPTGEATSNADDVCMVDADGTTDTPIQSTASEGCPRFADTCKNQTGLDPSWNYMDLSDDACRYTFTPEQRVQIHANLALYRKDLYYAAVTLGADPIDTPHFAKAACLNQFDNTTGKVSKPHSI